MNNNFNFFADFMKAENFTKNMPNFDISQMTENMRQNAESFTEAGQVASESMQAIIRRGTEILQENASHIFNSMKDIAAAGNPETAVNRQQQFMQNFLQSSVANTKEIMDMSSKAMMEVFDKVSKNTVQNNTKAKK